MVRLISTLIVVSWLAGSQPPPQPTPPPAQPPPSPQTQPTQPPRTTPPPEQQPAPTPTPPQTAATPDTPTPPIPNIAAAAAAPSMDPDRKTALALLDRAQALVEDALQNDSDKSEKSQKSDKSNKNRAVGTSGTADVKPGSLEAKSGRITVDRAMLDEVLSEIAQVRMMLQR